MKICFLFVMMILFPLITFGDLMVELVDVESTFNQSEMAGLPDTATYNFTLDITSNEMDAYIPLASMHRWTLIPDSSADVKSFYSLSSTAEKMNYNYLVEEGETEEFNFIINLVPRENSLVNVRLDKISWTDADIGSADHYEYILNPAPVGTEMYISTQSIPEPSTIIFVIIGIVFMVGIRSSRRKLLI